MLDENGKLDFALVVAFIAAVIIVLVVDLSK